MRGVDYETERHRALFPLIARLVRSWRQIDRSGRRPIVNAGMKIESPLSERVGEPARFVICSNYGNTEAIMVRQTFLKDRLCYTMRRLFGSHPGWIEERLKYRDYDLRVCVAVSRPAGTEFVYL